MHKPPLPRLFVRAARQMEKAVLRGDVDAAWRWSFVVERQLDMALKLVDLDPADNRLRRFAPALGAMRRTLLRCERFRAPDESEADKLNAG